MKYKLKLILNLFLFPTLLCVCGFVLIFFKKICNPVIAMSDFKIDWLTD